MEKTAVRPHIHVSRHALVRWHYYTHFWHILTAGTIVQHVTRRCVCSAEKTAILMLQHVRKTWSNWYDRMKRLDQMLMMWKRCNGRWKIVDNAPVALSWSIETKAAIKWTVHYVGLAFAGSVDRYGQRFVFMRSGSWQCGLIWDKF